MTARDVIGRIAASIVIGGATYVGLLLLYALALIQLDSLPFARDMKPDRIGPRMGKSLSEWMFQASLFITFASDEKPFPWRPWPHAD